MSQIVCQTNKKCLLTFSDHSTEDCHVACLLAIITTPKHPSSFRSQILQDLDIVFSQNVNAYDVMFPSATQATQTSPLRQTNEIDGKVKLIHSLKLLSV